MGHPPTYDAEGRIKTAYNRIYTYDAFGRRVRTTIGSYVQDFLYDREGRMVTSINAGNGAWQRGEVSALGQTVATYVNSTTYFSHTNQVGTPRVRTNYIQGGTGTIFESYPSLPFGDGMDSTGASPVHFTGHERDAESGLDHTLFRQYSSTQGRWLTPDPLGSAAVNIALPQTWNRFGYVLGNPTGFVDPLGLLTCVIRQEYHSSQPTGNGSETQSYVSYRMSCYGDDGGHGGGGPETGGGGGTESKKQELKCAPKDSLMWWERASLEASKYWAARLEKTVGFGLGASGSVQMLPEIGMGFGGAISSMIQTDKQGRSGVVFTLTTDTPTFQNRQIAVLAGLQVSLGTTPVTPGMSANLSGGAAAGAGLGAGIAASNTGTVTATFGVGLGAKVSGTLSQVNYSFTLPICEK